MFLYTFYYTIYIKYNNLDKNASIWTLYCKAARISYLAEEVVLLKRVMSFFHVAKHLLLCWLATEEYILRQVAFQRNDVEFNFLDLQYFVKISKKIMLLLHGIILYSYITI